MKFSTWDTVFNLFLLILWFRIWVEDDRDLHFNPYLTPLSRLSDSVVNFLKPVFLGLSPRLIATAALVLVILLRGALATRMPHWLLRMGFEVRQPMQAAVVGSVVFSFLSFGQFLFKVWGLSLLFVRTRAAPSAHTTGAIYHLSKPFTHLGLELRPAAVFLFGLSLAFLLHGFGAPPSGRAPGLLLDAAAKNSTGLALCLRLSISTLSAWVDLLGVIQHLMVLLIVGSWISVFTGAHGIAMFCREWMDLLLGPLRRRPIRLGMLDLSPLVFLIALVAIQILLQSILLASYQRLV